MSSSSGQQPGQPPQENQLLAAYKGWQEKTAFVTRFLVLTVSILTLLSFVGLDFTVYFANIPAFSIMHFEIYRIVLSPFVSNSFITLILMLFFFPQMGTQLEQQLGSAAFGGLVLSLTLVTNIAFAALCLFLSIFGMPEAMLYECAGFWTVIFSLITIDCMKNPEQPRRLLCFPWDIPSQYFPLAMFAFFSLFGRFELSFLVAIGIGYAYSKGFLDKAKFSEPYLESLEDTEGVLYNTSRTGAGWVFTIRQDGSGGGGGGYAPVNTTESAQQMNRSLGGGSTRGGFGGSASASSGAANSGSKPAEQFAGRGNVLANSGGSLLLSDDEVKARRLAMLSGEQHL